MTGQAYGPRRRYAIALLAVAIILTAGWLVGVNEEAKPAA